MATTEKRAKKSTTAKSKLPPIDVKTLDLIVDLANEVAAAAE